VAVNNNPYEHWEELKASSDYRSTDTQITSLVRQQLSRSEYLRTSNRVNSGPYRNLRAQVANSKPQTPHPLGSEDMWGWQKWTQIDPSGLQEPSLTENLLEVNRDAEVPGKTYDPISEVGGAST
jgi:hypothetical protein